MKLINLSKSILEFPNKSPLEFPSVIGVSTSSTFLKKFKGDYYYLDLTNIVYKNSFFIVICARNNTISGHIYVSFGREIEILNQSIDDGSFGYYPQEKDGIGLFYGEGHLFREEEKNATPDGKVNYDYKFLETKRFIIKVDKNIYNGIIDLKSSWIKNQDDKYFLLGKNCMAFVDEIANKIGLKTPKFIGDITHFVKLPWRYLQELINLNKT